MELSNRKYGHRYSKLSRSRTMKSPPSSVRIFAGYIVVKNLDTEREYETWMPDYVFDDIYKKCVPDTWQGA